MPQLKVNHAVYFYGQNRVATLGEIIDVDDDTAKKGLESGALVDVEYEQPPQPRSYVPPLSDGSTDEEIKLYLAGAQTDEVVAHKADHSYRDELTQRIIKH